MKFNIFKTAMLLFVGASMAMSMSSCKEETFTPEGDLFAPKFCADPVLKNNNDISLVWYPVNGAVDYTVRLTTDTYKRNEFLVFNTKETVITIEDLPYGQAFNIQVRANSSEPGKTSQWALTAKTTAARPEYAHILKDVDRGTIDDHNATVEWDIDPENPVDMVDWYSPNDATIERVEHQLTTEEKAAGKFKLTGLKESTLYYVNVYDSSKPRKYDKPYNQVKFRTTGPAALTVYVDYADDLSSILAANNEDPDIPEGTVYILEGGSSYIISPFAMKKGFTLQAADDAETKPQLIMNGTWNIYSGANIGKFSMVGVQVGNQFDAQYFFNGNGEFDLEEAVFMNCDFIDVRRGFWRMQGKLNRHIGEFVIQDCLFDHCGFQGSGYGTFHVEPAKGETNSYDAFDKLTIRNTTFMRDGFMENEAWGWKNLFYCATTTNPVNILIDHVTFYNYCEKAVMINITNTNKSTVTVTNCVFASNSGAFLTKGSATQTNYANNYSTSEYTVGVSGLNGTDLGVPATDVFKDPANGDLTVKRNNLIFDTGAGDPRWLEE